MEESLKHTDPFLLNGAVLAYVGDAVYELMVRQYVLDLGARQADKLHKHSIRLVNAAAQSDMIRALMTELTETEAGIFKRGRNASTLTAARNQSITDYRRATGLEALFGYLYLNGEKERLRELFSHGVRILEAEEAQAKNPPEHKLQERDEGADALSESPGSVK